MPHTNAQKTRLLLAFTLSLAFITPLQASDSTTASIYKFQHTMAMKGQPAAQYKLAMMHETGTGTSQDTDTARNWYKQAADQNYQPAINRLKYLDLVASGLPADAAWINNLQTDAHAGDGESALLLGQMYSSGSGVDRDYARASKYLRQAVASNTPGSETELLQVDKALEQIRIKREAEIARRELEEANRQATLKAQAQAAEKARVEHILKQKQIADARALRERQASLAAKQQTPPVVQSPALADRQVSRPVMVPATVTEIDTSPCSGRNRFAATCR